MKGDWITRCQDNKLDGSSAKAIRVGIQLDEARRAKRISALSYGTFQENENVHRELQISPAMFAACLAVLFTPVVAGYSGQVFLAKLEICQRNGPLRARTKRSAQQT